MAENNGFQEHRNAILQNLELAREERKDIRADISSLRGEAHAAALLATKEIEALKVKVGLIGIAAGVVSGGIVSLIVALAT